MATKSTTASKTKKPSTNTHITHEGALESKSQEVADQVVKRTRNRPDLANFGEENVKPGDNSRYLREALVGYNMPPIDISDPVQVEKRINEYFDFCEKNDKKPSMRGMGNWLKVDKATLNRWKNGDYRADTHCDLIKASINMLEELWVDYMQNGKVNPASGIFLGKNFFGYKDVQEVVVTPNNSLGDTQDASTLAEKYKDAIPME